MNVFSLFAKIGLDTKGYEQGLKESKGKFDSFADGLKGAAGKLGDVLAGVGKAAAAGVGAASTALTALTKKSLDAVADYEQLVDGVDKIFGESSKKVQEYANQAYSEAGLSANEYMNAVTSFSASLLQSLGNDTDAAADAANRAIIDMADNVNTYGSSMESVMNAYQGFSKQNYTMLDNLKLGYGGTKEEMQRLIVDASQMDEEMQKLGVTVDADSMSFGNIVNAISVMQERMKIAGTTHNEASRTISGSIASMKAAWQNFLTGTGSPQQFTKVLKDVVNNVKTNLQEIIPRLTEGLTELTDLIAPEVPQIIEQLLPAIITGASALLTGLSGRLPELLTAVLPALSQGVVDVSVALVQVMPQLIESLKQSIPIVVQTIMSKKDELLEAGKGIVKAIFPEKIDPQSIADITSTAASVVGKFAVSITEPKNIKKVVDVADDIIGGLVDGLINPDVLNQFLDPEGEHSLAKLIDNIAEGIKTILLGSEQDGEGGLFGAAKKIIENLGKYFADEKNRQNFIETADKIIRSLGKAIISILQNGVAPLMVEAAKAYMEVFIGDIDYTDAASEIIKRLGEAFVHNMMTGGVFGMWIDKAAEDYLEKEVDPGIGYQPSTDYYTTEGMISTGHMPAAAMSSYLSSRGYNAAFYNDVPMLAAANTSYGDNVTNITINADSNSAGDIRDAVVSALDEKMANYQAQTNRGFGYVGGGR